VGASVAASDFPLFLGEASRPIAWCDGHVVALAEFQAHVAAIASGLPPSGAMINLCEDRYKFLAAYAAALSRRHQVLLPASRVEQVVNEVQETNAGSYRFDDAAVDARLSAQPTTSYADPGFERDEIAMVGHTSGSTGRPQAHPKRWSSMLATTQHNAKKIRSALQSPDEQVLWLVATVPPQHMYGMELSVVLPMLHEVAVYSGRPLFPADIARALSELPRPRVLVSTPVHLRAIVESAQTFPEVGLVISATAPLDQALASAVEAKLGARLLEMFGSTETCVFASRRTAIEEQWHLYDGVTLQPSVENTRVSAPWFATSIVLQDIIELRGEREFIVRGRNADMIDVAGKRASLADLTKRLLAIEGVKDAVVLQPESNEVGAVRRLAALVVSPTRTARDILQDLASCVDPAFLPRPLVIVESLPRNEVGKLPREKLLELLREKGIGDRG
jgi:acyl-coenzyme A synthetase/AMP-(fatty) acid ligase